MITHPVNISPKGQIVLPKIVRTTLNTQYVIFEIIENQIMIKPLVNVKGSLSKYSLDSKDFSDIRQEAWQDSFHDRTS